MPATRLDRSATVTIDVDGRPTDAFPGESVATALLAAGVQAFRRTPSGAARAPFCNMGVCFDCVVTVDGEPGLRACVTPVCAGMRVETDGAR